MKLAAAALVVGLACSACGAAGPAPQPQPIERGQSFSLRPGEWAQTRDGALRIGFEGVAADSRCPKGEQCAWAGDATVRVWLQLGAGPRQARELRAAPGAAQAVRVPGHELRLMRLDPYPVAGRPVASADYSATLTLSGAPAGDPER